MSGPELNRNNLNRAALFYIGGSVLILFVLQVITGALLSVYYKPSVEDAFLSVQYINDQVEFGAFIRSIHYWSAHALIFCMFTFVVSAFLTKTYKLQRYSWYFLILTLFGALTFAFTGQTLPWTEFSYFGGVIGLSQIDKIPIAGHFAAESLKGGSTLGNESLSRFYSFHTVILPACMILLLIYNFVLIRYRKYSVDHANGDCNRKTNYYRLLFSILCVLAVITIISVLMTKGLGKPYNILKPSVAPEGIHPEWYFMWIYQTLKADNFLPGIIIRLFFFVIAIFWLAVPLLDNKFSTGRNRLLINIPGIVSVVYIFAMTIWGYLDSGISPFEFASPGNIATGGIDRFSFLGIILFTIIVMIALLYLRMKSPTDAKDGNS